MSDLHIAGASALRNHPSAFTRNRKTLIDAGVSPVCADAIASDGMQIKQWLEHRSRYYSQRGYARKRQRTSMQAIYGPPSSHPHFPEQIETKRYFEWVPGTAQIKRRVAVPAPEVLNDHVIPFVMPTFDAIFGRAA